MRKERTKIRNWNWKCRILISFTIFLWTNIPSNAQSLKTYSGEYKLGKATYTYQDNPEGGRIFEGNFTYTYAYSGLGGGMVTGSATGRFKNNKKEGVWTYIKNETTVLKATYKEGVLNGLYDFSTLTLLGRKKQAFSIYIKDGKFVGPAKGIYAIFSWPKIIDQAVDFTGQFDENGNLDGKWVFKNRDGRSVYTAIYEHGNCKKYYREDLTTGDIEQGEGNITYYLNRTIGENFDNLEQMVDRNNKKWKWYAVKENDRQEKKEEYVQGEAAREGEVFKIVEQGPEYPGGAGEMQSFITRNINYPEEAGGEQGRVIVEFVVNKDGSISDVKVIRGLNEVLDKEAARVIQSMPNWKPGKQRGKTVRVRYSVPVMFRLK